MMHIAIVEAFVSDQEHLIEVTNHQFNWWFDSRRDFLAKKNS